MGALCGRGSPVSTAGSVPIAGGEEGLVHALCEGLRQGAPGDPDGTHPAAAEAGAGVSQGLPEPASFQP